MIDPNVAPTSTVDPASKFISPKIPPDGEGTSKFTLSVSSSTMGSSTSTLSPLLLSHFATVASVMLSPRTGTTIFSDIYLNTLSKISFCCLACLLAYPVAGDAAAFLPI